jgi:glycogen debranching enzyme
MRETRVNVRRGWIKLGLVIGGRRGAAGGLLALMVALMPLRADPQEVNGAARPMELTRSVRPWEFLPVTGMKAGLLGNESGQMEAWVYPLKIFREFGLKFHSQGRVMPAADFARTVTVRPESATILYAGDTFTVRETLLVPVNEPGAVILMDIETEQPLEIEAVFHRDFQLEWPAALGATYVFWADELRAFYFGEEQRKFVALAGSPMGVDPQVEYQTNYSESQTNSFRLGATAKGKDKKIIVIAGSMEGRAAAEKTYKHLQDSYSDLWRESADYYAKYLQRTVGVALPDAQMQGAYDWARVSAVQGLVTNPFLGTGLVAGYRTSGESQRPGFAWFFGRDSFWTALALNAEGDFANSRTALEFIAKFQREDGKIPHEISQGANFVDWFKGYPYGYASADATPLYIIAMDDYVTRSGDAAFAKQKWDSLWKAYQFMRSTYDDRGLPKNAGVGHGWIEGGPLLPIKSELYQAGLGAEALRALSSLARISGKADVGAELAKEFEQKTPLINEAFWLADKKRFAFALDNDNHLVDEPTVLATVPMWFGLLDEEKSDAMITQLAEADHQTDWGMRIISGKSAKFSGGGYHYGSVWPLFTGWASVAEYRYHRANPAYGNLRANALLAFDGSFGHVTEVLSGAYYQSLSTSSPHQIWSAAMVVSPLLRGMLGLEADAGNGTLIFAPHAPPDWSAFGVHGVQVGAGRLDLQYAKDTQGITLNVQAMGTESSVIDFRPALSLRAKVLGVEFNGHAAPFHVQSNTNDQHVLIRFEVSGDSNKLRIRLQDDFGVTYNSKLPEIGQASKGLRILSETWTAERDQLTLSLSGLAGSVYELAVWNPEQIKSIDGAKLVKRSDGAQVLQLVLVKNGEEVFAHGQVTIYFVQSGKGRQRKR